MKNIFLLPTELPSRIIIYSIYLNNLRLLDEPTTDWKHKRNLYVTSDEEIKDGDYYLYDTEVLKCDKTGTKDVTMAEICNKIILSTDPTLIADGVQAIADELLEWFVKNPTCEHVDVYKNWNYPLDKSWEYEIIIPQEEPKQESHICKYCNAETTQPDDECYAKPEQETLEKAAEQYSQGWGENDDVKSFIAGGKHVAKRMYSEEEVINAFNEGQALNVRGKLIQGKEWFEQFKKK